MSKIMVNNIAYARKQADLFQLFASFGEVMWIVLVEGRGPKHALVHMLHPEEALVAVDATNGHQMNYQPLRVEAHFA